MRVGERDDDGHRIYIRKQRGRVSVENASEKKDDATREKMGRRAGRRKREREGKIRRAAWYLYAH